MAFRCQPSCPDLGPCRRAYSEMFPSSVPGGLVKVSPELSRLGVSLEKLTLLSDKFSPVFCIVRYRLHVISDRDGS